MSCLLHALVNFLLYHVNLLGTVQPFLYGFLSHVCECDITKANVTPRNKTVAYIPRMLNIKNKIKASAHSFKQFTSRLL